MFPVHVICPHCQQSLLRLDHMIHGHPAVHLLIKFPDKEGEIFLSSLYGDYYVDKTLEIVPKSLVSFECPNCSADLATNHDCRDCGAPMVQLKMKDGGEVEFCSRYLCKRHSISFSDISKVMISNFMQRDLAYVSRETPLLAVAKTFKREHCQDLPVVGDDLRPLGVINILAILEQMYPLELGNINVQTFAPLGKDIEWLSLTAGDIMKPIMHIMDPDMPILEAGLYMIRENVPFVVVCKLKTLVGVLTIEDITVALIDRKLLG